jgi:hypothetical protein
MKRITITILAALLTPAAFAQGVDVPAGHSLSMTALGAGELAYECKAKAAMPGAHEWVFVGPTAVLYNKTNMSPIGKYYAGPTWEAADGSKATGKQLAVSPSPTAGNIPHQLVQAMPAEKGAMSGITYIQRMNTKGGVAPADVCDASTLGTKKMVKYEADYLFYKAS